MSEAMFAKVFLGSMDRKPVKLSSDYVSDPKQYPAQSPYILPKPTHPFPRRERPDVAAKARSINVSLKPMKATSESLALPSQPIDTTILDLKTQYATKTGLDVTKIKMLLNKRPCSDLKTIKDIIPDPAPADIEFTLMIMGGGGGAASSPAAPSTPAVASPAIEIPDPVAKANHAPPSTDPAPLSERIDTTADSAPHGHETATDMLKNDEFWSDLKAFLIQRLRNESEGERLVSVFRQAV